MPNAQPARRAEKSTAVPKSQPDRLTSLNVADWWRTDVQLVEGFRRNGFGPPFIKEGRYIRYQRAAVIAWLDSTIVRVPPSNIKHHLDRHALHWLEVGAGRDPQELLKTEEAMAWVPYKLDWFNLSRSTGKYGPAYCRFGSGKRLTIRYRVKEVREWLEERDRIYAAEYTRRPSESSSSEG